MLRTALVIISAAALSLDALPVERVQVGAHTLHLDDTSFADAARMFGAAPIHRTGDASEFVSAMCYRLQGEPASVLLLESGPLGAGETVEGVELGPPGTHPALEQGCAELAVSPAQVVTDRQIALGMTRSDVEARLGPPAAEAGADVSYLEVAAPQDPRGRDAGYATSTLTLRYSGNRVTYLSGWLVHSD